MGDDPAHDRIAAIIKAVSDLVTQPPTLIGFDFAEVRAALHDKGCAVFGQGEASGEDRAIRVAELALADIRRQTRREGAP